MFFKNIFWYAFTGQYFQDATTLMYKIVASDYQENDPCGNYQKLTAEGSCNFNAYHVCVKVSRLIRIVVMPII